MKGRLARPAIGGWRVRLCAGAWLAAWLTTGAWAQKTLTWEQAKREFEAVNPNLLASRIGIQEARADEITAYLRPNPDLTVVADQFTPFTTQLGASGTWTYRPFSQVLPLLAGSYLIERQHKRSLRRESAQGATAIAISQLADQERTLLFDLRTAFVQVLQQKAVLAVTRESLTYYDRVLDVSRDRLKVGDIARVDLDRLELQRVQFETDVQMAIVNLRTAKIQFRALLNDKTPIERLDVVGRFDYTDAIAALEEFRQTALVNRPDLRAAEQAVTKAKTDYQLARANGSTDPTIGWDLGRNPPGLPAYIGFNVTIPLRIFDRNQGEKERTRLDIGRNQDLVDATKAQIVSDVDSAYAAIESNLILLHPYTSRYLLQAARVRETISFSYQRGGASLLDFLQAQQDYRAIQLSYVNLVGAFLIAAAQMNVAVGVEVIQ
jgi:cobalt-zinc-cadmium efflux system outer membrane protein